MFQKKKKGANKITASILRNLQLRWFLYYGNKKIKKIKNIEIFFTALSIQRTILTGNSGIKIDSTIELSIERVRFPHNFNRLIYSASIN